MPWYSPLFRIVLLAFRVPLNSLDGEEEEDNLQFLDLQVKIRRELRVGTFQGDERATRNGSLSQTLRR